MPTSERQAFEEWASKAIPQSVSYDSFSLDAAWQAWQARAQLEADRENARIERCRDAGVDWAV